MRALIDELRQAVRSLRMTPGYSAVAVATLALGIGANAAIFAAVNGVFLQSLPYLRPDRLVNLWEDERGVQPHWTVSPANYLDWKARNRSFEDVAAFNIAFPVLSGDQEPERVLGSIVTPNFFALLGLRPALGSDFTAEHGDPGGNFVVLLSDDLWRRRYGGDASIVGRDVRINERAYTVIGVMPPGYHHPDPSYHSGTQLWMPIAFGPSPEREGRFLRVLGRLRDDASMEDARADLATIARDLERAYPGSNRGWGVTLVTLPDELFGAARPGLLLLLAATVAMLLIVCTNVANLTLARSMRRTREFAVRCALGSGRARLVRGVLLESLLVATAGGALGLTLVLAAHDVLAVGMQRYVSSIADPDIDILVVAFSLFAVLVTSLLFGTAPALKASRTDLRSILVTGGRGSSGGGASRGARRVLVASEVALTTVLVVAAALIVRSFVGLVRVDTGLRAENVLTFEVTLPGSRYGDRASAVAFYIRMLERLRALPGVLEATASSNLPFTPFNNFIEFRTPEMVVDAQAQAEFEGVAPGYFGALGIPLVAGRDLDAASPAEGVEEVVVNQSFAERSWPGQSALGKSLILGREDAAGRAEVIGIAGNVLDDGLDAAPEPMIYRSMRRAGGRGMSVLLATGVEPVSLVSSVRRELAALDGDVPVSNVRTLDSILSGTLATRTAVMIITGVFAVLALCAAALGIYGVLAFMVGERTREIGIRTALGATPGHVVRLVLRESLQMVGVGLTAGVALALIASRLISSLLFGVSPHDPLTFAAVSVMLLVLGGMASYWPVRRATRVDSMRVLRQE